MHVLHCNGEILEWCGRKYTNLPTKCGHLEIEIPPGCYMVCATWSPGGGATVPTSLGNHISHLQIIRANCGDEVCVTLFPPTQHWCGIWWIVAARENLAAAAAVPREAQAAMKNALQAMEALHKQLPADPLTMQVLRLEQEKRPTGDVAPKRGASRSKKSRR